MNIKYKRFMLLTLLIFLVYPANYSVAKVKFAYKLMVTDYRGNRRIDYTTSDPATYFSHNGGSSLIKGIRVLGRWRIRAHSSLYGKSLAEAKRWHPKRPLVASSVPSKEKSEKVALRSTRSGFSEQKRSMISSRQGAIRRRKGKVGNSGNYKLNPIIVRRVENYRRLIKRAAKHNNLDPKLLKALVYVESAGNYRAISPKRAMGLTQLIDTTAQEMGVHDPFDPSQNLFGGAKYLRQQIEAFNGDESVALAAYNAGPTRVRNRTRRGQKLPVETQNYVRKVLAIRDMLAD